MPDQQSSSSVGREKNTEPAGENNDVSLNKAVVIPPGYDKRPDIDNPMDANDKGTAFSKNMKGLNLETLFLEEIDDEDKRFDRLEQAVIDFRREYEEVRPAIMRLTAIEADIQSLLGDLKTLAQTEKLPSEIESAPVEGVEVTEEEPPAPVSLLETDKNPVPLEQKVSAVSGGAKIEKIRIGLHPDKERIVIELSDKNAYDIDLDNEEKILVVSFPGLGTDDSAVTDGTDLKSYLISSYDVSASMQDLNIIFQLKKTTKVFHSEWLNAGQNYKYHRLIIDLEN